MKHLANNQELYDYLLALSAKLRQRGGTQDLLRAVEFACSQAASSSAEFLGESRIALKCVLNEEQVILSAVDRADLEDIVKQLDAAMDGRSRRG